MRSVSGGGAVVRAFAAVDDEAAVGKGREPDARTRAALAESAKSRVLKARVPRAAQRRADRERELRAGAEPGVCRNSFGSSTA